MPVVRERAFPDRDEPAEDILEHPAGDYDEQEAEDLEDRQPLEEPEYGSDKERLVAWTGDHNLARYLDLQTLQEIGDLVVREYEIDEQSRAEWKEIAEKALEFATQEAEPKQYPWPEASNFIFPLITTAALRFAAITYPALIEDRNVVRGVVWGADDGTPATVSGEPGGAPQMHADGSPVWLVAPGEKQVRADNIGEHMSWQLLTEMPEWEPQFDQLLHQLPIVGGAMRKTFFDEVAGQNCSLLVPIMDLVWNKGAPSFEAAPRHTEILRYYPHEIEEFERADETFLPAPYSYAPDEEGIDPNDTLAPQVFLEQHRRLDLDGDGYAEPLIITVHKQNARVVRIQARFEEDGIHEDEEGVIVKVDPLDYYTLYPFLPDLKGGSYPLGFGHLLKPLNEGINTSVNQMFDAGHLQIAGGGFIGTSLSIHSGPTNFQMGEYKPVNNKGMSIRDSIFPIPWPGPSQVLFALLQFLVASAKEIASLQDILSGDPSLANVQPTTLLALIEQGMKLYTAIHKRVYRAFKAELAKLYKLNRKHIEDRKRYKVGDKWAQVTPDDYRLGGGVEPVADPNMVTDTQKIARAMVLFSLKDDPLCDPIEIRRRFLVAARTEHIEKVLKLQPPPPPPAAQMEMALQQANLGRARAAEQKDMSQAILNLSMAKKTANESEMVWFEGTLEFMRAHIEAVNSQIKAADVDAKFHGHNVRARAAGDQAKSVSDANRTAVKSAPPMSSLPLLPAPSPPTSQLQSAQPGPQSPLGLTPPPAPASPLAAAP